MKKQYKLSISCSVLMFCIILNLFIPASVFAASAKKLINKVLSSKELKSANIGVKVISLEKGEVLFEKNPNKLFVPASNVKLITAFTALKTFGPYYTFKTSFLADSVKADTISNLYLKSYGDPSLSQADLNSKAIEISAKVKFITGSIFIDNSYFDDIKYGKGWMWDDGCTAWNAPISACVLNGNCIYINVCPADRKGKKASAFIEPECGYATVISSTLTDSVDNLTIQRQNCGTYDIFSVSGTISIDAGPRKIKCSVSNPAVFSGLLLKTLLAQYGTKIKGGVYEARASTQAVLICQLDSKPLSQIISFCLKESDNLTAEILLKNIGAKYYGEYGSAEKGIKAAGELLEKAGIKKESYKMADGSGCSTYNLFSADVLTSVLKAAYDDFSVFPEFLDSLSSSSCDGTLKSRVKTVPAGIVRAKTGTMTGVSCISGYVKTQKGKLLAFSIMMNGFVGSSQPFKEAQDEILDIIVDKF